MRNLLRDYFGALLLMGPSLILSVWLALRIRKDAKLIGLSGNGEDVVDGWDNRFWSVRLISLTD